MGLGQFQNISSDDRHKIIILVSDGEPYPQGHAPCISSTGYISTTLQDLRSLGVSIISVGVAISNSTVDEYFMCIADDDEDFFFDSDFDNLPALADDIGDLIW